METEITEQQEKFSIDGNKNQDEFGQIVSSMVLVVNHCYKGKKLDVLVAQMKNLYGIEITTKFLKEMVEGRNTPSSRILYVLSQANLKTTPILRFYGDGAWKKEVLKKVITNQEYETLEAKRLKITEAYEIMTANRIPKAKQSDEPETAVSNEPCINISCKRCQKEIKLPLGLNPEKSKWEEFVFDIYTSYSNDILEGTKYCLKCEEEMAQEEDEVEELETTTIIEAVKQEDWDVTKASDYIFGLGELDVGNYHWFSPDEFCQEYKLDKKTDKDGAKMIIQKIYQDLGMDAYVRESNGYLTVEIR
jgi:hypothetical protein